MSSLSVFCVCVFGLVGTALLGQDSQTVTLDHPLQIPGATLKPGEYTFAVEDRLADRAIIRITGQKENTHELLLAVPDDKLNSSERGKLLFFPAAHSDKQILQGWMCSSCQSALQVVYPKAEAVEITGERAKPVMAVDPTYDKLPDHLSPDDMKVVTLWLLSPKEITPEQKGKGVEAAKYADIKNAQRTQALAASQATAGLSPTDADTKKAWDRATAPPRLGARATTNGAVATADTKPAAAKDSSAPTEVAKARHMPHTASNTYNFGLAGLVLLFMGALLHIQRRFGWTSVKARSRK